MSTIPTEKALADKYALAIGELLDRIATSDGGAGSMNAVLGALTSVQARFIASLPDRAVRRACVDAITKTLPKEVTRHIGAEAPVRSTTIFMTGKPN